MILRFAAAVARKIICWWRARRAANRLPRGGRGGAGPDSAGVIAKLKPRPPVLIAQFAEPLPKSEDEAA